MSSPVPAAVEAVTLKPSLVRAEDIIEADPEPSEEYDAGSFCTSTKSVSQSIFDYVKENGRSYHRYRHGSYLFPNDEIENDRLDLQYEILKMLFEGRAYFAPLKNPKKILDIGTGTGIWPIEM
ncbi:hypothetical protein LTR16_001399, partial [Cryomyces antarcticus]